MSYDTLDVRRLLESSLDSFAEHFLDAASFEDLPNADKVKLLNQVAGRAKDLREECQ